MIDTGIDINNNEISLDNIDNDNNGYVDNVTGWDVYNNTNNVRVESNTNFHGAHISGIITSISNLIDISDDAQGAKICNISLATFFFDEKLKDTIENSKMLFVVSAGNGYWEKDGFNIDDIPIYPAVLESNNIITVTNINCDLTYRIKSINYCC